MSEFESNTGQIYDNKKNFSRDELDDIFEDRMLIKKCIEKLQSILDDPNYFSIYSDEDCSALHKKMNLAKSSMEMVDNFFNYVSLPK